MPTRGKAFCSMLTYTFNLIVISLQASVRQQTVYILCWIDCSPFAWMEQYQSTPLHSTVSLERSTKYSENLGNLYTAGVWTSPKGTEEGNGTVERGQRQTRVYEKSKVIHIVRTIQTHTLLIFQISHMQLFSANQSHSSNFYWTPKYKKLDFCQSDYFFQRLQWQYSNRFTTCQHKWHHHCRHFCSDSAGGQSTESEFGHQGAQPQWLYIRSTVDNSGDTQAM